MNIYFSGIGGSGIGPLAQFAHDAGYRVFGSDLISSPIIADLTSRQIPIHIGPQDGQFLQQIHTQHLIDWFVYTSSLPADHPELLLARKLGIRTTKRSDILNHIIREKNLQLIAISGTHGKTTTTSILIWALRQLQIPASHLVGTTLSFAPSGQFLENSRLLIYECDEFDRNFLNHHPDLAIIPSIGYDHCDTYPTQTDYLDAFYQFIDQSQHSLLWMSKLSPQQIKNQGSFQLFSAPDSRVTLLGIHNRANATLAIAALKRLFPDLDDNQILNAVNSFPGCSRRFERLTSNLYSDYAHHPDEITSTIQLALEQTTKTSQKLAVIYQPHQNIRQHQIRHLYQNAFTGVDHLIWLPTFLTREDASLPVLTPAELTAELADPSIVHFADLDTDLINQIQSLLADNHLVLLFSAGSADPFLRQNLTTILSPPPQN